jgi:peptide/nickel transport system substrate-binding protein
MKKLTWQIVIVVVALIAIGILLISQQPSISPVSQEIEPATGGSYTEGLIGSFGRLNPVLDFNNSTDRDIDQLIFSSLIRFDNLGNPTNDLIESMGISQDGKIYNISLKENAIWHDGNPVTSDDILFTIELLKSADLPIPSDIRTLWESIEVEALDERTIQFRLPEPYAPFIDYLTFGILPKHLLSDLSPAELIDAPFNLKPVGSGPYKFVDTMVENDQITGVRLEAFKDYYRDPAFIEEVNFRYYPDSKSAYEAYKAKEILGISQVDNDTLPQVMQETGLNLYSSQIPLLTLTLMNLDNPEVKFFQDPNVRRALLMGIDRQNIIQNILGGQATQANGPIFPGSWAYYDGIESVPYDSQGAIRLLKQAGYTIPASGGSIRANSDGEPLSFEFLYPDTPEFSAVAQAIADDWAKLGVDTELKPVSYDDLVTKYLDPRNYQAALVDLSLANSPDPDPYQFWHQAQKTGGQNYSKWDDRQASEFLEQARIELDWVERARLYRNFQVRFAQELPALPLFYPIYNYAVDEQVQGISLGPLFDPRDRFDNITKWFLVAQRPGETPQVTPTPAQTP